MTKLVRMFGPPGTDECNHGTQKFSRREDGCFWIFCGGAKTQRAAALFPIQFPPPRREVEALRRPFPRRAAQRHF